MNGSFWFLFELIRNTTIIDLTNAIHDFDFENDSQHDLNTVRRHT